MVSGCLLEFSDHIWKCLARWDFCHSYFSGSKSLNYLLVVSCPKQDGSQVTVYCRHPWCPLACAFPGCCDFCFQALNPCFVCFRRVPFWAFIWILAFHSTFMWAAWLGLQTDFWEWSSTWNRLGWVGRVWSPLAGLASWGRGTYHENPVKIIHGRKYL